MTKRYRFGSSVSKDRNPVGGPKARPPGGMERDEARRLRQAPKVQQQMQEARRLWDEHRL